MSTMEDKASAKGTPGRAQCSLKGLRMQFGYSAVSGPETRPEVVEVAIPGYFARWVRVSGDMYEREDT